MALESFPIENLSPILCRELEDFFDSQDTAHPFQLPQWGGPGSIIKFFRTSGRICWAGTFRLHSPLGRWTPWIRALTAVRGPVADDRQLWRAVADELAETMEKERIIYLEVSPEWIAPSGPDGTLDSVWEPASAARTTLRLDLTKSEDDILENFRKNSRYEVRRAERLGIEVSLAASEADIEDFLRVYLAIAVRKHFASDPAEDVRRILSWLAKTESRGALLIARVENKLCGGAVIVRTGRRCWYVWGASEPQEHFSPGHVLQWRALQWAKAKGCTEYDFGGYTPGATSGPAWFKAGFGGSAVQFVATHRRVTDARRHRFYRLLLQAKSKFRG